MNRGILISGIILMVIGVGISYSFNSAMMMFTVSEMQIVSAMIFVLGLGLTIAGAVMKPDSRAGIIILGIIISIIVILGIQMLLPFPYGLGVAIITPIVIFVLIKKKKPKSKPQNDDIQKLASFFEKFEKDKEKKDSEE